MYDLRSLGWNSFQQLCHTITGEILGQTVESFLDSHDGGRDGAFTGNWTATGQEDLSGPFVIQCKFTNRANYSLRPSDLSDEVEKAAKLVKKGICKSYVLMTNAGVSGTGAIRLGSLFEAVGVEHFRILGSNWINRQILENKRLRMLVPRMYGLGDLSQILDERAYAQARSILESMRDDLAKVVITDAYRRSAEAIDKHSFVLLIGEPASGKTTIASLLSMAALDQWNASILKLDDPSDVAERWNPDEPSQFFWLDDAFGVTQYEESLVSRWNYVLPRIQPMLQNGAKIVITSRDYIYNRARKQLKDSAFPLLNESQVVIDVHKLTIQEKEQILYNHVKLGNQTRSFRKEIKSYLQDVAGHPRFIPEIARRLGNQFFTKDVLITASGISDFVEKREQILQEILRGLDTDSSAALGLVFMRNGRLESPIQLQPSEILALERLGSSISGSVPALNALNGSLVRFSSEGSESYWHFSHPTVGDAYTAVLVQNPEHLDIFIQGSETRRLLREITCGDVGLENAIVVPKALFSGIIKRLKDAKGSSPNESGFSSAFEKRRNLQGFLTYRCSEEFISLYLEHDPDLLEDISRPGLFLDAVPEVPLVKHIHALGLLPEIHRKKFVKTVSEYALEGDDGKALSDQELRKLFTDDEFEELIHRARQELLPRLGEIRRQLEYNHEESVPAGDHMQPLFEFFNALLLLFREDLRATDIINYEIELADEWINETYVEEPDIDERHLGELRAGEAISSTRSIFDDIDAEVKR